ncbi:MAG: transferrin-binding protein-like solute binding protein [Pseudomonadota bacterium]
MKSIYPKAFMLFSLSALVACSGGSSGSGPDNTGFSTLPISSNVTLSGLQTTAILDSLGNELLGATTSSQEVVLRTDVNGDVARVTVRSPIGPLTVDCGQGSNICSEGGSVFGNDTNGSSFIYVNNGEGDLEFTSYGVWVRDSFDVGGTAIGFPSPNRDRLPASAVYRGGAFGLAQDDAGVEVIESEVTVTTDFSTADFETSDSRVVVNGVATTAVPKWNMSGALSVNGTSLSGSVSGTGLNGTVEGQFFGLNGEEVGGVLSATGTGGAYVGAFGAAR